MSIPSGDTVLGRFLVDGYVELTPSSLTADDHRALFDKADRLYERASVLESETAHLDVLGDNLRAQIPELDQLLADSVVDDALTAILGRNYLVHPHSYCHRSSERDQMFHQDGNLPWNQRGHVRSHRPDWAMLFYYPQQVDDWNGPTEVVAGSQYWTIDNERADGTWEPGDRIVRSVDERFSGDDFDLRDRILDESLDRGLGPLGLDRRLLRLGAGTVLVAHYDLVHRGTRAITTDPARYMYKFYFARVHEPEPSAGGAVGRRPRPDSHGSARIIESIRDWLDGEGRVEQPSSRHDSDPAGADHGDGWVWDVSLDDATESERLDAAYRLGRSALDGNVAALDALALGLRHELERCRRAAGYGLRVAAEVGIAVLVSGLEHAEPSVRRHAAAGLGTAHTANAASSEAAIDALLAALTHDPDDLARSNAAYSLGVVCRSVPEEVVVGIVDALLDRLEPGVEPINATEAALPRSTVRQEAAFAVVQALANHRLPAPTLERIVDGPLRDGDRYVQGLIGEGLARAAGLPDELQRRTIGYLNGRRWSPSPPAVDQRWK